MLDRTPAERVDHLVDAVLAAPPAIAAAPGDPELRRLAATATRIRAALAPVPAGSAFEERLSQRLADAGRRQLLARELFHVPTWIVMAGAVSSAAVGVTAYAVWRGNRRPGLHRLGGS